MSIQQPLPKPNAHARTRCAAAVSSAPIQLKLNYLNTYTLAVTFPTDFFPQKKKSKSGYQICISA